MTPPRHGTPEAVVIILYLSGPARDVEGPTTFVRESGPGSFAQPVSPTHPDGVQPPDELLVHNPSFLIQNPLFLMQNSSLLLTGTAGTTARRRSISVSAPVCSSN